MKKIVILINLFFFFTISSSQTTLQEGFEEWPPQGWEIYELGIAFDGWIQDWQGISHTGNNSAYSGIDNSQCDNWLVSSSVNIINSNYELRFWEYSTDILYYDKASVLISSGSPNPEDGDFVEVLESSQNEGYWQERVLDLSAYSGQTITIAFRYEGTWHNWFVDDVNIAPATYYDGELTQIINPIGVSEIETSEDIIVELRNSGNLIINDVAIELIINDFSFGDFNWSSLNLQPNESVQLTLTSLNFSFDNAYNFKAILTLTQSSDFNILNNTVESTFEVTSPRDGLVVGVNPEAMSPNAGVQDVSVIIENIGLNDINIAEIEWSVDDNVQTPYSTNSLSLLPGETTEVIIGSYNFNTGLHEIAVTLNAFGDINEANDSYISYAAVDIFWESFEGRKFPPENWTIEQGVLDNINFDYPVHGEKYYASVPEWNLFYNVPDTLFTPLLDISAGDKFNFYLKGNSFSPDNTSLIWKDGSTGEIHHITNISSPTDLWELHEIDISAAAGVNYIGILNEVSGEGANALSKFDLFTSDAKLYVFNNDLGITNGDIYFLAKQNTSESFNCKIRNFGNSQVSGSEYTVKLMESSGNELASVQGVTLNSWEETTISINHTFNTIDQHRLYFEIVYTSDENIKNNIFREATVNVVPNTIEFNTIGHENGTWSGLPFNASPNVQTLGEDDLSQALYYSNEFNIVGEMYGVVYNYSNLIANETVQQLPLKVWVGQTNTPDLSGGWYPDSELELVFDGIVEVLPGFDRQMYIPFNSPILYNGLDNIIIQHYQYDPEYPTSLLRFENINVTNGHIRSIQASDIYNLDPNNPPGDNSYYLTSNFTYANFVLDPIDIQGVATGTVYDANNTPLENANITIEGSSLSELTDSNGNYTMPSLPYGYYDVTATLFGYYDDTQSITLDAANITQDFHLLERPQVDVFGKVVGSNNEIIPIENVEVSLNGYIVGNTVSDNNGDFIFSNVYGDIVDYNITLSIYGYNEKTIQATVTDSSLDLGVIILNQEFLSPYDVEVENDTEVLINWSNPFNGGKEKIQLDMGVDSNGYSNEPNEEVWLGNIFPITEITTLSSVEIVTFYIESVADFVSIDVIDVASNEILASSEPFLIDFNSVQTIDIPNIVVHSDIAVMVHWQNNPATTNYLNIDFSDPAIQNSAAIRYPGEAIQLLSDYFGAAQNFAFHVRLNTLDDGNNQTSNEELSFNIYRGLASEFPDINNWDQINATPVTGESLVDNSLSNIDVNQYYRYAVETTYVEGVSEVTFSNIILGNELLSINEYSDIISRVILYPNPATEEITLKIDANYIIKEPIEIYNLIGKKVLELDSNKITNGYLNVNIKSLNSGIYFMEINIEGLEVVKKFIVK